MNKISVIVPCYNSEDTINRCLDSIVNQTIGKENIEILLVDGCSTDSTASILKSYEEKYEEQILLVVCDEKLHNGELCNTGLIYASGDYVCFINPSTYLLPSAFELLMAAAQKECADIVQYKFSSDESKLNEELLCEWNTYDLSDVSNRKNHILQEDAIDNSCYNKLFKKSLLERANVSFSDKEKYNEIQFVYPLIFYANKICTTEKVVGYCKNFEAGSIVDYIGAQMYSFEAMRKDLVYAEYKKEIDYMFLHKFYVEPIFLFAKQKNEFPIEMYRMITSWIEKVLPEWEENEYILQSSFGLERSALMLMHYSDKSDTWIKEQLKFLFYKYSKKEPMDYLKEMADGIESGEIFGEGIEKYNNKHLMSLFMLEEEKNNKEIYCKIYDRVISYALEKNRAKLRHGEKLRVAFLPYSSAEWPAEKLYFKMQEDDRFEPYIVPMPMCDRSYVFRKKTYEGTRDFFVDNNYDVREIYDISRDISFGWEEIGGIADIVIHLSLWDNAIPYPYQISEYPFGPLVIYVPYGITVEESPFEGYKSHMTFNRPGINMLWKSYVDSNQTLEEYKKYELLAGRNVIFSGYTKMDYFYQQHNFTDEDIKSLWKIPEGKNVSEMKRIIIAPHHSLADIDVLPFATFDKNKDFLLEMARKYKDSISFVFKPHPNLSVKAVYAGVFKSIEEYEAYLDAWRELPNCKVVEEASYLEYFVSSDGMIMDSISFTAEYVYANKPMLFLQRDTQMFNELGSKIMEAHYKVPGTDFDGIRQFIEEVILNEQDSHKPVREKVFAEELDYVAKTGMLASEYVYKDIVDGLSTN